MAMQRALLIALTEAYCTTTTLALQVLRGKIPLDLKIVRRGILAKIKQNLTVSWKGFNYTTTNNGSDLGFEKS